MIIKAWGLHTAELVGNVELLPGDAVWGGEPVPRRISLVPASAIGRPIHRAPDGPGAASTAGSPQRHPGSRAGAAGGLITGYVFMCIFAVIIYAVFAQAGVIPQNPQAEATRAWLDRQAGGGDNAAAMEAARRAILEQKREDARAGTISRGRLTIVPHR